MLAAVEASPFAERDRTILFLLAGDGPGEKEVVALQVQHYDRLAGTITIPARGTKGRTSYRRPRLMEEARVGGQRWARTSDLLRVKEPI